MAEPTTLAQRIQAEFDALGQRKKASEQQQAKEAENRQTGLATFGKVCEDLKSVWQPRLEAFAKQFGQQIKVTPSVTPSQREAKVIFLTNMATMTLTLSVAPSADMSKLVFDYDLFIVPIFFDYERHAKLEMPLDRVDKAAAGKWFDDQLVGCVKTYLAMQENPIYIERSMVEDPTTKVKLRPEDAKAKFEHRGQMLYFASEENLQQYKKKLQIDEPSAAAAKSTPAEAKPPAAPTKGMSAEPKPPAVAAKAGASPQKVP